MWKIKKNIASFASYVTDLVSCDKSNLQINDSLG